MALHIADLIDALPEGLDKANDETAPPPLDRLLQGLSHRSLPTGRLTRARILGSIQAKVAVAYLTYWIRTGYKGIEEKQRLRNEANLGAALELLDGMSYLRGAVMKVGQMLSNYPMVVPLEFSEVLGRLHFEAPPMHFSLLREFVRNELGADPEDIFDDFEPTAISAASLGQVHRARLKGSRQPVAVKVQYPKIGRTIRDDSRNLLALLAPMRLSGDWDSVKVQMEDVARMLTLETDYSKEAANLATARSAFDESEGVVIPRVFEEVSTSRVLTMEYVEGVHLDHYLRTDPSQADRDKYGTKMALAAFRLSYRERMLYADPHPGNYFFRPDGRLGVVDFGCCHHYSDAEIDYVTGVERAFNGSPEERTAAMIQAADMNEEQAHDPHRMRLLTRLSEWFWEPIREDGAFDFSDGGYFQRGVQIFGEVLKRRYLRSIPVNTWLNRNMFGLRAMLTKLRARVDLGAIVRQETTVKETTLPRDG